MRVKRGPQNDPFLVKTGPPKWALLGDPLTRDTPKLILASWTRKMTDFGHFADSQKVLFLVIFVIFVIFDVFFHEKSEFS